MEFIAAEMRKMVKIMHINKEEQVPSWTKTFRRQNAQELPETPNIGANESTEIIERHIIQVTKKLKNWKSLGEDQILKEYF